MAKTQRFEITKDFGSKTLEKVFVKEQAQQEVSLALRDKIKSALAGAKTVCIVAKSAFSGTLMDLLLNARNERGIRIYVIVKSLSGTAFEQLKNNCIVREVPEISGNYLLCDTNAVFFFDADLSGYALHDAETVHKLHDIFIYEFWNNASKEFVAETKPVAERTFDVAPVEGSEHVIIDRSALEAKPYQMCLDHADSFVVQKAVCEQLKNTAANGASIYLDKQGCMAEKDWLLKTNGLHIVCTDTSHIPQCKSNGEWYTLNSNFDKTADNTGKLFAVQLEETPAFANTHTLKDSFTYREAVGKTMFRAKDFSPVAIDEIDREERSISYDYKQFKKIAKMTETEREAFFDKFHLLESDKLAASVSFSVTMTVKKISKGAELAPIYADYKNFIQQRDNTIEKITKDIDETEKKINSITADLKRIENEISKLEENKISENDEKKNSELQKQREKLDAQKTEKQEVLKAETNKLNSQKALLESVKKVNSGLKTVADCELVFAALVNTNYAIKIKLPAFDLPQYGTLYKVRNSYEYELTSDEDSDKAEAEMSKAGISDVEFVSEGK